MNRTSFDKRAAIFKASRQSLPVLLLALVLPLGSCVTGGDGQSAATKAPPGPPAMERVVNTGYSLIASRYIDPVENKTLSLFALRGLNLLDPAIEIDELPDTKIALRMGDKQLGAWDAPRSDDVRGWARLTSQAVLTSFDSSTILKAYEPDRVLKAVMEGALRPLDKHSRYSDPVMASDARFSREGAGGVGLSIRSVEGRIRIASIFPGMPASRAGFKVDDVIAKINDENVDGYDERQIVRRLRGDIDSDVTLTVLRGGDSEYTAKITRALIIPPTVQYAREGEVAVIKLTGFNQATTSRLQDAIEQAQAEIGERLAGIVLDMRGNPGGLLDQAISVADLFLEEGVVTSTKGRHPDSGHVYRSGGGAIATKVPMVILINGRSASAAEIVAAALQDRGRAVVIGTNSYGKGSVQTVVRLPNEGELTLTWSRLYAPSGYSWHEIGVMPTVCTSDLAGEGENLSSQFNERTKRMTEVIALWHANRTPPTEKLTRLRETCKPSDTENEKDTRVAVRMLKDKQLYDRAIGVTVAALAQLPSRN
ncbi:MAG: S41 family peptidase [Reyranellaceae bacterium]